MSRIEENDLAKAEKLNDNLDYHYTLGIQKIFQEAGKFEAFMDEATEAEIEEQKKLAAEGFAALFSDEGRSLYCSLKVTDIFTKVARRAAQKTALADDNDAALASQVRSNNPPPQDYIDMLERYQMNDLASVLRKM